MRFGRRERLNLGGEKSETWAARKLSVELLHSERQVRICMKLEKMIGVERQLSKRNKKGEFRAESKKKANCVKSEEVDVIKRKERELIGKKKLLSSCNKNKCFAF